MQQSNKDNLNYLNNIIEKDFKNKELLFSDNIENFYNSFSSNPNYFQGQLDNIDSQNYSNNLLNDLSTEYQEPNNVNEYYSKITANNVNPESYNDFELNNNSVNTNFTPSSFDSNSSFKITDEIFKEAENNSNNIIPKDLIPIEKVYLSKKRIKEIVGEKNLLLSDEEIEEIYRTSYKKQWNELDLSLYLNSIQSKYSINSKLDDLKNVSNQIYQTSQNLNSSLSSIESSITNNLRNMFLDTQKVLQEKISNSFSNINSNIPNIIVPNIQPIQPIEQIEKINTIVEEDKKVKENLQKKSSENLNDYNAHDEFIVSSNNIKDLQQQSSNSSFKNNIWDSSSSLKNIDERDYLSNFNNKSNHLCADYQNLKEVFKSVLFEEENKKLLLDLQTEKLKSHFDDKINNLSNQINNNYLSNRNRNVYGQINPNDVELIIDNLQNQKNIDNANISNHYKNNDNFENKDKNENFLQEKEVDNSNENFLKAKFNELFEEINNIKNQKINEESNNFKFIEDKFDDLNNQIYDLKEKIKEENISTFEKLNEKIEESNINVEKLNEKIQESYNDIETLKDNDQNKLEDNKSFINDLNTFAKPTPSTTINPASFFVDGSNHENLNSFENPYDKKSSENIINYENNNTYNDINEKQQLPINSLGDQEVFNVPSSNNYQDNSKLSDSLSKELVDKITDSLEKMADIKNNISSEIEDKNLVDDLDKSMYYFKHIKD